MSREGDILDFGGSEKTIFARCPSSDEMLRYVERDPALGPFRRLEIRGHLVRCELCRKEAAWASEHVAAPRPKEASPRLPFAVWFSRPWTWAAVAAALTLTFTLIYPSNRFARYAQVPDVPYETIVAEFGAVHPAAQPAFRAAVRLVSLGEYSDAKRLIGQLETRYPEDPSILFIRGHMAAREGRWQQAAALCLRSEPHNLNGFRCWYLANVALQAGQVELARKEIAHASDHIPYRDLALRLKKQIDGNFLSTSSN